MNNQIDKILSTCTTVAIIGHVNPDGDCFGSICGMHDYIVTKFKASVHCFADCNMVAEEFVPFVDNLKFNLAPLSKYDACICVDTADLGRLGKYTEIFNNSTYTICIDHHATNVGFADINMITHAPSNSENVYNLLKANNYVASKSTLSKICAGILTDTANLSTDAVNAETFEILAEIKRAGVDVHGLQRFFFGGNTLPQFKLLSKALNSAKLYNNNTIIVMQITQGEMDECGATQEDLSPIISEAFCMKHALCALLITPRNNQTHVSFRARHGLDVSIIAEQFGGGGHKPAAAFTVLDFDNNDLQNIINQLTIQINNLPKQNKNIFN